MPSRAGMKLKLLGRAIRQGEQIAVFVSPHFVAGAQPLAPVSGVLNAIEVLGNNIGNAMFFGPGAGGRRRPARCWVTWSISSATPAASSRSTGRRSRRSDRSGRLRSLLLPPHEAGQGRVRAGARRDPLAARSDRLPRRLHRQDLQKGHRSRRSRAGRGLAGAGISSVLNPFPPVIHL